MKVKINSQKPTVRYHLQPTKAEDTSAIKTLAPSHKTPSANPTAETLPR